ncbi:MAG: GPW/gp25 family protein [Chloroflexi bacterium]|nr:GPW/gp25 family protein [Chloroflexota bacterium]
MATVPRFRAWRFLYPQLDAPPDYAGLALNARGGVDMVQDNDSVRQAVLLLLSTEPGERVMRPRYGCRIHQLIFMPADNTTSGLAIFYVERALEEWEPRVEIVRLDARVNDSEPGRLDILLEYRVRATQRTDALTISLNLSGGRS